MKPKKEKHRFIRFLIRVFCKDGNGFHLAANPPKGKRKVQP